MILQCNIFGEIELGALNILCYRVYYDLNYEFDCVLVWKFDRFARSTRHLLTALEEFDHLGIHFISVQDQVDTKSPLGKAMFTIIGAMAAAKSRGKHVGRPRTPPYFVDRVEELAGTTGMSIRHIHR